MRLDVNPTGSPGSSPSERTMTFQPPYARSTLAAKENDQGSRPDRRPSIPLDDAPRWALRLTLDTAPGCLDSASTTNVRVTSTLCRRHLWRLPITRRGKPRQRLIFQAEIRCTNGVATIRSGLDAGPPRGHPASSGCVLDGTRAGFGPIDLRTGALRLAGSSGAFSAFRALLRS
jgi:hypothetical protein